ncbi:MAG: hypothetical protein KAS32_24095 [Candidatus Peribacteraceae bacterium]|nr:hypothetical protein [Candidatus Peribacteraceae bacterium]
MYYEEKLIGGILMFRTTPDGDWAQVSIKILGQRYLKIKKAFDTASYFIEVSVGDPDTTEKMAYAYLEYQKAVKDLKSQF